jgi:hypothetical protein
MIDSVLITRTFCGMLDTNNVEASVGVLNVRISFPSKERKKSEIQSPKQKNEQSITQY